jgi:IS30 family transposase
MARKGRCKLSGEERTALWTKWKEGESVSQIARMLDKDYKVVHEMIGVRGGIAPAPRRRCRLALALDEREEISRGIAAGTSIREIARSIGRAASTVSRELQRNGGQERYRAAAADAKAWECARRPKPCKLALDKRLKQSVADKLQLYWSPAQISGWLRRGFPDDPAMHVSHETIYRSLFVQARGVLKKELIGHLRARHTMRRAKSSSMKGQLRGQIIDAVSIRERPAEAEDRAVPGHWEGDLITGSRNTYIATLVERHSRFTMLVKVQSKDTASVVSALITQVRKLPAELKRSLTWDRGHELAQHKRFTLATDLQVYFCDPQSPWQRGSNENTNGLLRQYFPKGTNLSDYSQKDLDAVALQLNQRPRKTLDFMTPAEKIETFVASIG